MNNSVIVCIQQLNREATSQNWECFVNYVGLFFQALRRQKYRLLNIESIPAHRQDKFRHLVNAARNKGDSMLDNYDDKESSGSPMFSVILPPESRCAGCRQDLSGLSPQLQLQFPRDFLGADLSIQVKPWRSEDLGHFLLCSR